MRFSGSAQARGNTPDRTTRRPALSDVGFVPQPTLPSICSSMRRDHSTAYSIGSVRVTGSMKPLTTIDIDCSSVSPRLIR